MIWRSVYVPEGIDVGGLGEGQVQRGVRRERATQLGRQVAQPARRDAQAVAADTARQHRVEVSHNTHRFNSTSKYIPLVKKIE